jgi:hypothetical protein
MHNAKAVSTSQLETSVV